MWQTPLFINQIIINMIQMCYCKTNCSLIYLRINLRCYCKPSIQVQSKPAACMMKIKGRRDETNRPEKKKKRRRMCRDRNNGGWSAEAWLFFTRIKNVTLSVCLYLLVFSGGRGENRTADPWWMVSAWRRVCLWSCNFVNARLLSQKMSELSDAEKKKGVDWSCSRKASFPAEADSCSNSAILHFVQLLSFTTAPPLK